MASRREWLDGRPKPISWQMLAAWSSLIWPLSAFDIEIMFRLDDAFFRSLAAKDIGPQPTDVASQMKAILSSMANDKGNPKGAAGSVPHPSKKSK